MKSLDYKISGARTGTRTEVQTLENKRDATSKSPGQLCCSGQREKNKAKNGGLEAGKMACARAVVRVRGCASPMCESSFYLSFHVQYLLWFVYATVHSTLCTCTGT